LETGDQVRVGDEESSEGDGIDAAGRDRLECERTVVAVVDDVRSGEAAPQVRIVDAGQPAVAAGRAFDDVEIRDPGLGEFVDVMSGGLLWRAVCEIAERRERTDANADPIGADGRGDGAHDFDGEAHAILDRAAIAIGPLICAVAQELVEQIPVRRMNFDAVEARRDGTPRATNEILDNAGKFACFQRTRRHAVDEPVAVVDFRRERNGRWRDGKGAVGLERRM